jgi:hypothetical protein
MTMKTKLLGLATATMLLSGCTPAPAPPEPALLLVHGPAEALGVTPAWCYSTLADPDCFTNRVPEASDRLIGAYVPVEPADEAPPASD